MKKIDPFKIPFKTELEENRVSLQIWGEGNPFIVIPGLEGSGESCLHFIAPAIEKARSSGNPVQLCLVNYSKEKHQSIDDLSITIESLLQRKYDKKSILMYGQSFGNLLIANIGNRNVLSIDSIFMISPFKKLPNLMTKISYYSLFITPTWLYRRTIKPMGRYTFGPVGVKGKNHPFFEALSKTTSTNVRRQTKWLINLNYESKFLKIQPSLIIGLGTKDRLVNIKEEISFFKQISESHENRSLLLNEDNGHVIFIEKGVEWATDEIFKFLTYIY